MDKIESIRVNVYGLPPRGLTKTALVPIPILGAAGSLGNRTMREGITAVFMLSALAAATSGAALGAAGALVTAPSGTDLENVKKKYEAVRLKSDVDRLESRVKNEWQDAVSRQNDASKSVRILL